MHSSPAPRRSWLNFRSRKQQDRLFCFYLLLPAIILCVAFILIPIADSVAMSFTDYKIANLTKNRPGVWNDFANYTRLRKAGKLQSAISITGTFVAWTVGLTFVVSMALALILNSEPVGARFLRSIMMIPWVIPTVIAGLLWAWIYANPYGLLQYLLPLNKKVWSPSFVLVACGLGTLLLGLLHYIIDEKGWWKHTGFFMVFGTNAIYCYLMSDVITWVYHFTGFRSWAMGVMGTNPWTSLVFAVFSVLMVYLTTLPLYRRHYCCSPPLGFPGQGSGYCRSRFCHGF